MTSFTYRIPARETGTGTHQEITVFTDGVMVKAYDGIETMTVGEFGNLRLADGFVASLRTEHLTEAYERALAEDAERFPAVSAFTDGQRREIQRMIERAVVKALGLLETSSELLGSTHSEDVCDTVADITGRVRMIVEDEGLY